MVFGNKNWANKEELSGGTQRPRNLKSYCVMIYNKRVRFFQNTASIPIKACIFIVASWPELFFTIRNGVIERPIV